MEDDFVENIYPKKAGKAIEALLTKPAALDPALRQAIEAYAAQQSGGERKAYDLPKNILGYVNKVIFHAYKITDEDVLKLKEAGYSEDHIFEITLCAGIGASFARFERGMQAVKENPA
jgi:alkylhydroperoxidase family enzyme